MVQNLLDAHSKVYGGPEFDRLPNIITLRSQLQASLNAGRITEYTSKEAIDSAIINLIESLFDELKLPGDVDVISEKTPWNILFFEELFELFPKAKFVMVLRNPTDTFNSMKTVGLTARRKNITAPDFTEDVKVAVAYMEVVFNQMFRLQQEFPKSFHIVRYEDLISNFAVEVRSLCTFCNLTFESQMLEFYKMEHPGQKTMTADGVWYTDKKFSMNPKEVKVSKNVLTRTERAFINYMFHKNEFVNDKSRYYNGITLIDRIIGKFMFRSYIRKHRFKTTPKRTLQ